MERYGFSRAFNWLCIDIHPCQHTSGPPATLESAKPTRPPTSTKRRDLEKTPANNIHLDSSISSLSSASASAPPKPPVPSFAGPSTSAASSSAPPSAGTPSKRGGRTKRTAAATAARAARRGPPKAVADDSEVDVKPTVPAPSQPSAAPKTPKVKLNAPAAASTSAPSGSTATAGRTSSAPEAARPSSVLKIRLPRLSGISPGKIAAPAPVSDTLPTISASSMANGTGESALPTPTSSSSGRPKRAVRTASTTGRGRSAASTSARRSARPKRGAPTESADTTAASTPVASQADGLDRASPTPEFKVRRPTWQGNPIP